MNKVKILIVEDEPIVALDIKNTIIKFGHAVTDISTNYHEALISIESNEPDIIFMDIYLENSKNGIEIVEEIHRTKKIHIIYLTAFSDDKTMLKAIETNPVSYIIKPFKREELKSSILLSMYKMKNINKVIINEKYTDIGCDYYYDLKNDNLFYKKQPILISVNEKKFLRLLIEANGQIVPFSRVEEYIWQGKSMSDSVFRTLVYRLRSKLEFKLVETIPSFGYKLTT